MTLILEYLKVLLTGPVIAGTVSSIFIFFFRDQIRGLISRLATIRFPGGEISAPQPPASTEKTVSDELPPVPKADQPKLPASVPNNSELQEKLTSERARAYLWEYRYLNLFFVQNTQKVLDWFGSLKLRVTYPTFDTFWTPSIPDPKERHTIVSVLESHFLIDRNGELLEITPKGREYIEWRHKI